MEELKYSCGHPSRERLSQDPRRQEKQRQFITTHLCPSCWHESKKKKEENPWMTEHAKGFPSLQGSAKQVAWAIDLRTRFFEKFKGYKGRGKTELRKRLLKMRDARFWIDNKGREIEALQEAEEKAEKAKEVQRKERKRAEAEKEKFGTMKYIRASCEHNIRLRYQENDKELIQWIKTTAICPSCLKKKLKSWRFKLGNIEDENLPKLEGTPRQVEWARAIREGIKRAFENIGDDEIPYFRAILPRDRDFGTEEERKEIQEWLFKKTDVEDWIILAELGFDEILDFCRAHM